MGPQAGTISTISCAPVYYGVAALGYLKNNVFVIIITNPFRDFQKEKLGIFYTY